MLRRPCWQARSAPLPLVGRGWGWGSVSGSPHDPHPARFAPTLPSRLRACPLPANLKVTKPRQAGVWLGRVGPSLLLSLIQFRSNTLCDTNETTLGGSRHEHVETSPCRRRRHRWPGRGACPAQARHRRRSLRTVERAQGGRRRHPDQLQRHARSVRARPGSGPRPGSSAAGAPRAATLEHRRNLELVRSRRQKHRALRHAPSHAPPRRPACAARRRSARAETRRHHAEQAMRRGRLPRRTRGNVLHYPVRRGEIMNFVSTSERDDWQVESWSTVGTKDELRNDFRDWHADVQLMIDRIETPYKWALMIRAPMAAWSKGRVTLLGDACHPTLPFLGQGAVMSIEDGYVVAACLDKYFGEPDAAFARYEDIRRERTSMVVRKASENKASAFAPSLADKDRVAEEVAREWQQVRLRERMEWLYNYDATAIAI